MSSRVVRLLCKQLREIEQQPVQNVAVHALEDDIMQWHCNLFFPATHAHFPNLILHFIVNFDQTYPSSSPQLRLCTNLVHSHVYFPTICFSLLGDFRSYFESNGTPRTAFWNPTRTARSFLEDLSIFLLNDEDGHADITEFSANHIMQEASSFKCSCKHTFSSPVPALVQKDVKVSSVTKGEIENMPYNHLHSNGIISLQF